MNIVEKAQKNLLPKEIASQYLSEVKDFFNDYAKKIDGSLDWIDQDAPLVLWAIKDVTVSDIVSVLRNDIVKVDDLVKQIKAQPKEISKALSALLNAEFVTVLQDGKGEDYALLKTEPRIMSTFPNYIVGSIIENYNNGLVPAAQATRYLSILKDNYPKW
jgi:DNA-binding transcriptional ArsR family regulator